MESLGSRGPVGAEAMVPPELADNPLHPLTAGRGTEKGTCSYSPKDFTGCGSKRGSMRGKPSSPPQDDVGFKTRLEQDTEPSEPSTTPLDGTLPPLDGGSMRGKPSSPPQDNVGFNQYHSDLDDSLRARSTSTVHQSVPNTFALQWNMNGFYNNLADLEMMVRDTCPTVIAIQEVHRASKLGLDRCLSGTYKWHLKVNRNIYHSVAVGVKAYSSFAVIDIDTALPVIAIRINSPLPISVVCFYIPCGNIDDLNKQLNEIMEQIPEPRILLGDCNGHHPAWGSSSMNTRGKIIADVAETTGSLILNDGSKTYISGRRESTVDISMVSLSVASRFLWKVHDDPLGSDHRPIIVLLNDQPPQTSRRPRWIYDQADWVTFQSTIDEALDTTAPTTVSNFVKSICTSNSIRHYPKNQF